MKMRSVKNFDFYLSVLLSVALTCTFVRVERVEPRFSLNIFRQRIDRIMQKVNLYIYRRILAIGIVIILFHHPHVRTFFY